VLSVVLAALVVASVATVAFAVQPQRGSAVLGELQNSGITGKVDLRIDTQSGAARIHEQLSGLTPGAEYTSVLYFNSQSCTAGPGVVTVEIMTFTANPAGKAVFNAVVGPQAVPILDPGASISIQQGATPLACGPIVAD
jgi:hypothetical protein